MSADPTLSVGECLQIERQIDEHCQNGRHLVAADLAARYAANAASLPEYFSRAHYLRAYALFLGGFSIEAWVAIELALGSDGSIREDVQMLMLILAADIAASGRRIEDARRLVQRIGEFYSKKTPADFQLRYYRVLIFAGQAVEHMSEIRRFIRKLTKVREFDSAACLLTDLGKFYESVAELEKAAACWRKGISMPTGSPYVQADLLIQLGRYDQVRGRFQMALEKYQRAKTMNASAVQRIEAALRVALVRWDLNQRAEAKQEFHEIIALMGESVPDVLIPLLHFASVSIQGKEPRCISFSEESFHELLSSLHDSAVDDQSRSHFRHASQLLMADLHSEAISWFHKAWSTAQKHENYEVAWRSAVTLGRLVASDKTGVGASDESVRWLTRAVSILETQSDLIQTPINKAHYRFQMRSIVSDLLGHAFLTGNVEDVFRYLELGRGRLVSDYFSESANSRSSFGAGTLQQFRGRLSAEEAFVSFALIDNHIASLVVTARRDPEIILQPLDREQFLRSRNRFCRHIEDQLNVYRSGGDMKHSAATFDGALMEVAEQGLLGILDTIRERLRESQLILSLDATLAAIPVHAILSDGARLIEQRDVSFLPNAGIMNRLPRCRKLQRRSKGLVVSESPESLPLAYSEARRIVDHFPRLKHLHGDEATVDNVIRGMKRAEFIHLACHAETASDSPVDAAVHLPAGDDLTAAQIAACDVYPGAMAVLNCCRSAEQQKLISGESFSIAAGFLCAGAAAVIGALWSLPDQESSDLIDDFYVKLESDSPVGALCETQRQAIASGMSPLFWAPFILIGRGRRSRGLRQFIRQFVPS